MGIPFSVLYSFHFPPGLLVTKYTRCDHFWNKLSYNMFYGSKLIKWLWISNDIQKVLEGMVIFPPKNYFFFF